MPRSSPTCSRPSMPGREPAVTGQDGRDALEIICAVYESSRAGQAVSLAR